MSEPSEEAMDTEAMRILSSLSELTGPDASTKTRLHQRLVVGLGLPSIPGQANASLAPGPAATTSSLGLTAAAKLGVVVAIAMTGAVASYVFLQRDSSTDELQVAAPPIEAQTPVLEPVRPPTVKALVQSPEEAPAVEEESRPAAPANPPKMPKSTLAEERALLDGARTAMLSGHHQDALAQAQTHQRRFGRGRLAEERDALKIQLALRMSQTEHARRAFLRFSKRYPKSIYLRSLKPAIRELPVTEVGN